MHYRRALFQIAPSPAQGEHVPWAGEIGRTAGEHAGLLDQRLEHARRELADTR